MSIGKDAKSDSDTLLKPSPCAMKSPRPKVEPLVIGEPVALSFVAECILALALDCGVVLFEGSLESAVKCEAQLRVLGEIPSHLQEEKRDGTERT